MAWSLKESIEKRSKDPEERARTEEYLEIIGDAQPVRAAYNRAVLDNDAKAAAKILTTKAIFRTSARAKDSPSEARYLEFLKEKLRELEAS